ncbi:hypothetical protein [Tropicimonas sp. IMCC34043]|uniref:hypothetical protein n=1 Tax=Tropicimonas sp. IMCC34043 TaxID=2248760 RepID=UPI000E24CFE1|nr:hypothetical protein [Tropicimonas sp. IMCC34043]
MGTHVFHRPIPRAAGTDWRALTGYPPERLEAARKCLEIAARLLDREADCRRRGWNAEADLCSELAGLCGDLGDRIVGVRGRGQ